MQTAILSYEQPMNNGYFLNLPSLSRLYEFYLSIKYLEIQDEFNLLLNLHLCTQKSVCATTTRLFGEVGGMSPLQLSSRTHFAKIEDKKKLLRKIRSKNLTARGFLCVFLLLFFVFKSLPGKIHHLLSIFLRKACNKLKCSPTL